jgi:Fur family transcriptional regulator, ferric uptake regulator
VDCASAIDAFLAYLRDHNLPVTAQRQAIAEVVLCSDRHVSADEIERELWSRGAAVGTATIYRTLDVMVRSGLVVERDFGEGFRRFEPARDEPNHEHLICTVCGRVVEFSEDRLERMTMLLAEQHDFVRSRHKLVIEGVCSACRARPRTDDRGSAT